MSRVTYDFQIVSNTPVEGVALVMAQNEDAWRYISDELEYHTLSDGSAPLFSEAVGDFISDAEHSQLTCSYI